MTGIPQERIDRVCKTIQETGTALDLPDVLLYAAKTIGVTRFVIEDQGVMLYRLTVVPAPEPSDAEVLLAGLRVGSISELARLVADARAFDRDTLEHSALDYTTADDGVWLIRPCGSRVNLGFGATMAEALDALRR